MSRLCERPGCSDAGAARYGMVPQDLLFWIAPLATSVDPTGNVLCQRHADAMVVPIGWTLDDRREPIPRLFKPRPRVEPDRPPRRRRAVRRPPPGVEQLQIDGTGEIARPAGAAEDRPRDVNDDDERAGRHDADGVAGPRSWTPEFDQADDLGGVLQVSSPLLARAFRGTDRPRG